MLILHRGPATLVKNRVFWMLCSGKLPPERVASHRDDNGFTNIPEVTIDIGAPTGGHRSTGRARTIMEHRSAPRQPASDEQEFFPVVIPPSDYMMGSLSTAVAYDDDEDAEGLSVLLKDACCRVNATPPFAHTTDIGADATAPPKRRRPRTGYGLSADSKESVSIIVLSWLVRSNDAATLANSMKHPLTTAFLDAVRSMVLSVAKDVGGAHPSIVAMQLTTFFNMSGSHIHSARLYNGGLSLPGKLKHERAKALLLALLDSVAHSRNKVNGHALSTTVLQLSSAPHGTWSTAPPTPELAAQVSAAVAEMETAMRKILSKEGGGASSSSSTTPDAPPEPESSSSSPTPSPPPPPLPFPQPSQPSSSSSAPPLGPIRVIFDPSRSLVLNAQFKVEATLQRRLNAGDVQALTDALVDAMDIIDAGTVEARRQLLVDTPMVTSVSMYAAAAVWTALLHVLQSADGASTIAELLPKVTEACAIINMNLVADALTSF